MYSNNTLRTAIRLGLGIGAGALAVGFSPGALAQGAGIDDEPLEEIITTGSRIKRADLDSASPVTVLDREDILAQGITDVGSLIQRMPSMSGTPLGSKRKVKVTVPVKVAPTAMAIHSSHQTSPGRLCACTLRKS